MDWGEIILTYTLDLILTMFFYLLVPIIFCIRKKRMTEKQIKKIVYINGGIVWLLMAIITGNPTMAVFLWSWVGKKIMERVLLIDTENEDLTYECQFCGYQQKVDFEICPKCGKNTNQGVYMNTAEEQGTAQKKEEPETSKIELPEGVTHICLSNPNDIPDRKSGLTYGSDIALQTQTDVNVENKTSFCRKCGKKLADDSIFCSYCGTKIEIANHTPHEDEKKPSDKKSSRSMYVIIALSIVLVISLVANIVQATNTQSKLEFYDEYAVCVSSNNLNVYHKYGCSEFDDSDFWIFNIDYAEYMGYEPCPHCCE